METAQASGDTLIAAEQLNRLLGLLCAHTYAVGTDNDIIRLELGHSDAAVLALLVRQGLGLK